MCVLAHNVLPCVYMSMYVSLPCGHYHTNFCVRMYVHTYVYTPHCSIEQCKFFDSKMKPLLLTYTNRDKGDDRPIKVMFKSGDGGY